MTLPRFLIICTLLMHAAMADAANLKLVDELLSFEKTESSLGGMRTTFLSALERRRVADKLTTLQVKTLKSLGTRIYRGKNLYEVFRLVYAKYARDVDVRAKLKWIKSPIGQKLYASIKESHAAGAGAKMRLYFQRHAGAKLKGNRTNVMDTYMKSSRSLEVFGLNHKMCEFGVLMGMNGFKPKNNRDSERYLLNKLRTKEAAFQKLARDDYLLTYIYLFRDFDDATVDQFTQFQSSAAGQGTNDAYIKALTITLEKAGTTLLANVAKQSGQ